MASTRSRSCVLHLSGIGDGISAILLRVPAKPLISCPSWRVTYRSESVYTVPPDTTGPPTPSVPSRRVLSSPRPASTVHGCAGGISPRYGHGGVRLGATPTVVPL